MHRRSLALLGRVVVEKGHHLEGVRTGALHGLFGDDARFAGSKNDHGRGACSLETLIDRAHRDAEPDEQDGRSEQLDGHHAQGNRIRAPQTVGGQVLHEEQSGAGGERKQDPACIPCAAEPNDAGVGPEDQHAQRPDEDIGGEKGAGGDQFVRWRGEFEPDGIGQTQANGGQAQIQAEDGPARDQLGT